MDDALLEGATLDRIGVATRQLPVRTLPSPRRWWQLPDGVEIPRREVESYSSLAKLFDAPHGYVLRYAAKLRPGRVQDLSEGNRLYGNLAHRLFERYFSENVLWELLDTAARRAWFAQALPLLIEAEAAVLLEPGRGVEKQRVATTLERALVALIDHLRSADDRRGATGAACAGAVQVDRNRRRHRSDADGSTRPRHRARRQVGQRKIPNANSFEPIGTSSLRRTHTCAARNTVCRIRPISSSRSGHVLAQDAAVFPDAVVCAADEW